MESGVPEGENLRRELLLELRFRFFLKRVERR